MADKEAHEQPSQRALGRYWLEKYHPRSVLDLGCGTGGYLIEFWSAKAGVLGVDSCPNAGALLPQGAFICYDIADFEPGRKYDMALCIEVAEHLQPELSDQLVSALCASADRIVFSAAPPGQGGINHINCRPMAEWLGMFSNHNFYTDSEGTRQLRAFLQQPVFDGVPWLRTNMREIVKGATSPPEVLTPNLGDIRLQDG